MVVLLPKQAGGLGAGEPRVTRVAIIGAGPYGLSIAAHLRARGVRHRIFGRPLETWRQQMPVGMMLKSDGFASNLSAPDDEGTLGAYCASRGIPYHDTRIPVSLELFVAYATDFQERYVPDVEDRLVGLVEQDGDSFSITLDDGEVLSADFVVSATGVAYLARMPEQLAHLPSELATHSSAHHDLTGFRGRDVTVVGAGSSAIDLATLLHEAGATTHLVARTNQLRFSSPPGTGERSHWQRLRHPSSGMGPGLRSWLYQNMPGMYRYIPGNLRITIARRHLGPQAAWLMRERFERGVTVALGTTIERATAHEGRVELLLRSADGTRHEVTTDHVVAATGYWPDLDRLQYLGESVRGALRAHADMPVVSRTFETSVPGLYIVGPPALNSFGPLMRFMVGAEYVAPLVARRLDRHVRRIESVRAAALA
jgi:cation diffusion facilitator CzcD-associated flavoprotein CzcO